MHLIRLLACLLAFQLTFLSALVTEPALSKHALTGNDEEMLLARGDRPGSADELETLSVSRGNAKYKVLNCGKQTLPVGVYAIQSHNTEDNTKTYPNNINCLYSLEAADPQGTLHFQCFVFQLEHTDECKYEFLKLGSIRFCHGKPGARIRTKFDLQFVTNNRTTADKGFFCTILSKESGAGAGGLNCGDHPHLQPGTYNLLSKNHPANYDVLQYCRWDLKTLTSTDNIELACSTFDIESYDGTCDWDWMRVMINSNNWPRYRYCNANPPPRPHSLGDHITVEYTTSNIASKTRAGFNCTVSVKP